MVQGIIDQLSEAYGKHSELTVNHGPVHDYLGMTVDYSQPGKVRIGMDQYVRDLIDNMPDNIIGLCRTPAADHLFRVSDHPKLLLKDEAEFFHSTVAKLLFISKRARPDIQTAVSFLCTRVTRPDDDDY